MKLPIAQQHYINSKECPFYCKDKEGELGCIIKDLSNYRMWLSAVETIIETSFEKEYNNDCKGSFDNCCFANLIWSDITEIKKEPEIFNIKNTEPQEDEDPEEEIDDEPKLSINVGVHLLSNPYMAKADVLIYPTNNLLEIDDILLNRITRNKLQEECSSILNRYNGEVKMGDVYMTSNGGKFSNGVKAKKIYHAVVAGESRLVNDQDIRNSIQKAIMMADENRAEIVTVIPADCGTHDINQTAFVQISAIYDYLVDVGLENIKYIFIVMDDQASYESFKHYFSIIFNSEDTEEDFESTSDSE